MSTRLSRTRLSYRCLKESLKLFLTLAHEETKDRIFSRNQSLDSDAARARFVRVRAYFPGSARVDSLGSGSSKARLEWNLRARARAEKFTRAQGLLETPKCSIPIHQLLIRFQHSQCIFTPHELNVIDWNQDTVNDYGWKLFSENDVLIGALRLLTGAFTSLNFNLRINFLPNSWGRIV